MSAVSISGDPGLRAAPGLARQRLGRLNAGDGLNLDVNGLARTPEGAFWTGGVVS
jgi:hypothetical protein